jgi:Tfp pilus assembly PilM family ATPase
MRIVHPLRTVIGVDVGRRTIKAAQLTWSEGACGVCALSLLPRPEPEKPLSQADALALRGVLRRQGFSGRKIVVAAPDERLMRAALELPSKVAGAPIGQIVRMELSRINNVAPDSFEMAYWEWRTPDGAKPITRTLAIGCPHAAADDVVDLFEAEGFDVAALDVRIAAVGRACEPLLLPAPQITAIADLGWRSTTVQFVCGRSLLYERLLEGISMAELTGKLAEIFGLTVEAAQQVANTVGLTVDQPVEGIDDATLDAVRKHLRSHFDKLLDELRAPFSYVNHQFPGEGVKRLLLIGGGAAVPRLSSYMHDRLGIDVLSVAPSDVVTSPTGLLPKAGNPAMTLAVGLARFGRGGG